MVLLKYYLAKPTSSINKSGLTISSMNLFLSSKTSIPTKKHSPMQEGWSKHV